MQVAYILADLGLDDSTVCAALLHDVVEDTEVTKEDLAREFSEEIEQLVDGVTKLSTLKYTSAEEEQVENYRKMFLAMGRDIRVIIIKLADRLHNMRTLKYLSRERQLANAHETMDLYAPLANRLGIYSLKWELEDLAFKYLYPEEFKKIVDGIDKKRNERLEFIDKIMDEIRVELKKQKINAEIKIAQQTNSSYGTRIHRVKKGETLSSIAKKYGTTVSKIKRLNNLRSTKIRIGQRLKVKRR